jgi:type II secretory pathway component GspD/PulD (secretin)
VGRWLASVALLLVTALARGEALELQTFTLQYRTLEELVPMLRPLVPAPGVVTGMGDQLVVRTTAEGLRMVAEVLEEVDRPPRRLLISVRQERAETLEALGASLRARIGTGEATLSAGEPGTGAAPRGDRPRARVDVYATDSRDDGVSVQRVQGLEGQPALIRTGQSVPVGERYVLVGPGGASVAEGVRYLDVAIGFYVLPRVSGDQVTLEITPYSARLAGSGGGGVVDLQQAETVVSGQLGEWIVVATSAEQDRDQGTGLVYSTRRRGGQERLVLVRIDEVP